MLEGSSEERAYMLVASKCSGSVPEVQKKITWVSSLDDAVEIGRVPETEFLQVRCYRNPECSNSEGVSIRNAAGIQTSHSFSAKAHKFFEAPSCEHTTPVFIALPNVFG